MKDENLIDMYTHLLIHTNEIRRSKGNQYAPSLQKISKDEMENFKEDYSETWCGTLRINHDKKFSACLGTLKKEFHYGLLDKIIFRVFDNLMKPYEVRSIQVTDLAVTIKFNDPHVLQKALKDILELSTYMITVEIKKDLALVLYLGKICTDKKKQITYV